MYFKIFILNLSNNWWQLLLLFVIFIENRVYGLIKIILFNDWVLLNIQSVIVKTLEQNIVYEIEKGTV
jgi:hypothetical protein